MNWSLVDVVQGVPEASTCRDTPIVVGRVLPKKKRGENIRGHHTKAFRERVLAVMLLK